MLLDLMIEVLEAIIILLLELRLLMLMVVHLLLLSLFLVLVLVVLEAAAVTAIAVGADLRRDFVYVRGRCRRGGRGGVQLPGQVIRDADGRQEVVLLMLHQFINLVG